MYSGGYSLCINKCCIQDQQRLPHFFFSQVLGGAKGVRSQVSNVIHFGPEGRSTSPLCFPTTVWKLKQEKLTPPLFEMIISEILQLALLSFF